MKRLVILLSVLVFSFAEINFSIIHTNDLHSNIDPYFPRISHFIKSYKKTAKNDVLLLDCGDWSSGSLFHMMFISYVLPKYSPELEFFNHHKFDATMLGNHEFDGKAEGIYYALKKANNISDINVPIITTNLQFTPECSYMNDLFKEDPSKGVYLTNYVIKEVSNKETKESVKIGILGIYGPNSAFFSQNFRKSIHGNRCIYYKGFDDISSEYAWDEYVDLTYNTIKHLKEKKGVKVIIVLGHSGQPEDSKFISLLNSKYKKYLPLIDIHLSSHTHHKYYRFENGVLMNQNGGYGNKIGILELQYSESKGITSFTKDPTVDMFTYTQEDPYMKNKLNEYIGVMDRVFLKQLPYKYETFMHKLEKPFKNRYDLGEWLCSLLQKQLTKELIMKSDLYQGNTTGMVDIYFNSIESIRLIKEGNIANKSLLFADLFQLTGVGHNMIEVNDHNLPGDNIVHFYIKKSFLYTFITASRLYSFIDIGAWFTFSDSLQFKWRWFGIPMIKNEYLGMLYDIKIHGIPFEKLPDLIHVRLFISQFRLLLLQQSSTFYQRQKC